VNIVNVGYHATNYYVLADSSPRLLIDAGWPGSFPEMQHASNRKGIRLADIQYQLVTHYHPDHAGLAQELKRLGVKLIVIETQVAAIPLLRDHVKPQDNFTDIMPEGNIVLSVDESRAFLEGIGIAGEIVSTPGHSDDSVTLILDEGIAFTGDLTSPLSVPENPEDLSYQSWQRIRAKGVSIVYPGHGPPWYL
jgi:glyoxylase-like metal-dependent hydrolase (beta-lactamase superfamily II)